MNTSNISSRIQSLTADVSRLQDKIATAAKDQASAADKVARATEKISRARTPSQVSQYTRDLERAQKDSARHQKKQADINKEIARKQKSLASYQKDLSRSQVKQSNDMAKAIKNLEAETSALQRQRISDANASVSNSPTTATKYDAFISHASDDKDDVVRALAEQLADRGFKVWYDELTLKVGDSLRRSIDQGLASSRFGIVIISPSFLAKNWPQYELDGMVAREMQSSSKVILPIWHKVSKEEVMQFSPTLADKLALNTAMATISELADQLQEVLSN